jgi:hypothetical protein
MINPAPEIRKGLYALLNGNVSYDSVVVPVYEGEGVYDGSVRYQVLVKDDNYTDRKTKSSLFGRVSVNMEIVTEETGTSSSKAADAILNEVFELLLPNVNGTALSATGFQITSVRKNIRPIIREYSGQGKNIVRRLVEINFLINQINV